MPDEQYPFPVPQPTDDEVDGYIREAALRYALAFAGENSNKTPEEVIDAAKTFATYLKGEVSG